MKRHDPAQNGVLIANPASAGGRTARLIGPVTELLETRWDGHIRTYTTSRPGEAEHITAILLRNQCPPSLIAVLGGDGTLQEVCNGLMDVHESIRQGTALGIISSGTGQGLAQSLSLPSRTQEQIDLIAGYHTRMMDLGLLRFMRRNIEYRYFVNECQFGIGGEVVRRIETRGSKRFNGRITFGWEALVTAASVPNQPVSLAVDGAAPQSLRILGLVLGNGAFTGGGMNLTVGADPCDGRLDLLVMREQSVLERISNLTRIYSARHIHQPQFTLEPVRKLRVTSPANVPVEADGEFLGYAPVDACIIPRAIRVITGAIQ